MSYLQQTDGRTSASATPARAVHIAMVVKKSEENPLKGWSEIAKFLGQPVATAQHWAKSGMPVTRKGRYVYASRDELGRWLGRESGVPGPVHISTDNADLAADLRRGLSEVRRQRQIHRIK